MKFFIVFIFAAFINVCGADPTSTILPTSILESSRVATESASNPGSISANPSSYISSLAPGSVSTDSPGYSSSLVPASSSAEPPLCTCAYDQKQVDTAWGFLDNEVAPVVLYINMNLKAGVYDNLKGYGDWLTGSYKKTMEYINSLDCVSPRTVHALNVILITIMSPFTPLYNNPEPPLREELLNLGQVVAGLANELSEWIRDEWTKNPLCAECLTNNNNKEVDVNESVDNFNCYANYYGLGITVQFESLCEESNLSCPLPPYHPKTSSAAPTLSSSLPEPTSDTPSFTSGPMSTTPALTSSTHEPTSEFSKASTAISEASSASLGSTTIASEETTAASEETTAASEPASFSYHPISTVTGPHSGLPLTRSKSTKLGRVCSTSSSKLTGFSTKSHHVTTCISGNSASAINSVKTGRSRADVLTSTLPHGDTATHSVKPEATDVPRQCPGNKPHCSPSFRSTSISRSPDQVTPAVPANNGYRTDPLWLCVVAFVGAIL